MSACPSQPPPPIVGALSVTALPTYCGICERPIYEDCRCSDPALEGITIDLNKIELEEE